MCYLFVCLLIYCISIGGCMCVMLHVSTTLWISICISWPLDSTSGHQVCSQLCKLLIGNFLITLKHVSEIKTISYIHCCVAFIISQINHIAQFFCSNRKLGFLEPNHSGKWPLYKHTHTPLCVCVCMWRPSSYLMVE